MEDQRKLCVLFVDDEPSILGLLPHLLADMREHWQMSFAESAVKGLELLAQSPCDVVVSDFNMPGMNGVEFLKEVRERYPLSARIIYSSACDPASIASYFNVIHQFLPKPCPTDLIKATVQRAAMIRSLVPNPAIREKISKMERIPSLPSLFLELVRQLQSVETEISDIARTISQDIGMTAQILKIVNSAAFSLPQPVSNVADAIGYLGYDTVKNLVLAAGIFSQFESRKLGGISLETLWQHGSRTAELARAIARSESAGRQIVDESFAAGLLHDVGKLIFASNFPERYEEVGRQAQANRVEWLIEEREAFNLDHADVGGYLLGLWGLPAAVVEAVTFHHYPTKSERTKFSALSAVHVANVLVQTQRPSYGGIVAPQIDHLYLAKIGRGDSLDRWRDLITSAPSI